LPNNIQLLIIGYFIGAIPFGYIAGKLRGIDIRKEGSGNIGSTNVSRILGKRTGIIVQVLDIAKGIVPVALGQLWNLDPVWIVAAGIITICGHNWTIFLGFKGGKGVNTSLGVALGIMPIPAIICFAVWIAVVSIWKYISLGSIAAAITFPILAFIFPYPNISRILTIIVALFIIIRHKSNIERLLKGEEPKIAQNSKVKAQNSR
jgi:acyl phosphate:glycerol-3-phosphate acyltransferase